MTKIDCEIIRTSILAKFLDPSNIEIELREAYTDEIILKLTQRLIQGPESEVKEYKHPKTWWDAFKFKYLSRWLNVEYTVIKTHVTFKICPHLYTSSKDKHIRFILNQLSQFDDIDFFNKGPFKCP